MHKSPAILSKGKRILLLAYACEPEKGSESGIGWEWAKGLAQFHKVLVVTRENNRQAIEKQHLENKNLEFFYYDIPKWLAFWKNGQKGIYLYYLLWQIGIFIKLSKYVVDKPFDFSMSLTFGNMWLPTFLGFLPIPYIWGPIGGGEHIPFNFFKTYPFREFAIELLRNIWIKLQFCNLFFILNCALSKLIIVRTKDTFDVIPNCYKKKTRILLETAMDLPLQNNLRDPEKMNEIRMIYTGRLIPLKNVDIAIKAFSIIESKYPNLFLTIVGDGPERRKLITLANKLHISNKVNFVGQKSREFVLDILSKSDIYIFPSIKECGPWSLLEAMATGLPVICFDTGGMSDIVSENTGVKISPINKDASVLEFANAIDSLISDSRRRKQLANNSKDRITRQFSWDYKITEFNKLIEII